MLYINMLDVLTDNYALIALCFKFEFHSPLLFLYTVIHF